MKSGILKRIIMLLPYNTTFWEKVGPKGIRTKVRKYVTLVRRKLYKNGYNLIKVYK
jgi:hypothetical protein